MRIGASSACFYPEFTETGVERLQKIGIAYVELFMNTFQELDLQYRARLKQQLDAAGTQVLSFHPFTSAMESFFFSSAYERRLSDGIELYRRLFDCAAELGAKIFILHGDYKGTPFPFEGYCENFARLFSIAREYGLTLCQENVSRCRCGVAENVRRMRQLLGDEVRFVLDLKQAVRGGERIEEMLEAMGPSLAHLHLSDHTESRNCLPPGKGDFDFPAFFDQLRKMGYQGDAVVELYRDNFGSAQEIADAVGFLHCAQGE